MNSEIISFLHSQHSVPAVNLKAPAPDAQQLQQILQSAMSAPDHGELTPYRFLVIQNEGLQSLSEVFAEAAANRGEDENTINKQRKKPLRSPMIICVIASINLQSTIPEIEQMLTAGCAAQHIQIASKAMGYGSIWLTGKNCYDSHVHRALGLDLNEKLLGFIYLGSPEQENSKKQRASVTAKAQSWEKPQASDFVI